jgi:hypothetical protein
MTSDSTGWLTWQVGATWLVLSTSDGWRTVQNATPSAVPTGGGFVLAAGGGVLAAVVRPYERLTQSPLLTRSLAAASSTAALWQPQELPGAVVDDRHAVAVSGALTVAILTASGGTVVTGGTGGTAVTAGAAGWTTVTTATALDPAGHLHLDTVTMADDNRGWLTGHGPAGTPLAFATTDAGHSWTPLAATGTSAVAVLAPCGAGNDWLLPAIGTGGDITVERTTDGGGTWTSGTPLTLPAGPPVWGCSGDEVWIFAVTAKADHVFASADGGQTWADRGTAPKNLTELAPGSAGSGFAVSRSGDDATLWSVGGGGTRFTPVPLPSWISTLGSKDSDDS